MNYRVYVRLMLILLAPALICLGAIAFAAGSKLPSTQTAATLMFTIIGLVGVMGGITCINIAVNLKSKSEDQNSPSSGEGKLESAEKVTTLKADSSEKLEQSMQLTDARPERVEPRLDDEVVDTTDIDALLIETLRQDAQEIENPMALAEAADTAEAAKVVTPSEPKRQRAAEAEARPPQLRSFESAVRAVSRKGKVFAIAKNKHGVWKAPIRRDRGLVEVLHDKAKIIPDVRSVSDAADVLIHAA